MKTTSRQLIRLAFIAALLNLVLFGIGAAAGDASARERYVPDDGYYYVVLAQNFAEHGEWTFDGETTATGFHPLHAYLAAAAAYVSLSSVFGFAILFGLALVLLVASSARRRAVKHDDPSILASAAIILSSLGVVYNTISATEWALAVAISWYYWRAHFDEETRQGAWSVLALGAAGSLARFEFVGLTIAVAASSALVALFGDGRRANIRESLAGVAGAAFGAALVAAHNFAISGAALSSSSRVKLHWSELVGHSPLPFLATASRSIISAPRFSDVPAFKYAFVVMILTVGVIVAWLIIRRLRRSSSLKSEASAFLGEAQNAPIVAALMTLAGYTAFYSFNAGGAQLWHSSLIVVPAATLLRRSVRFGLRRRERATAYVVAAAVGWNVAFTLASPPFYQEQAGAAALGVALAERHPDSRVAAWDAGVVGYHANRAVINLDGLVNDEAVPYIIGDSIETYLARKGIDLLAQEPYGDRARLGIDDFDLEPYLERDTIAGRVACIVNRERLVQRLHEREEYNASR